LICVALERDRSRCRMMAECPGKRWWLGLAWYKTF